ncbi:MAG: hypothetical protein GXO43_06710 [Crenarchaeota archaeon]|nr:hypothetical protein [Thermoproteota archaeon]
MSFTTNRDNRDKKRVERTKKPPYEEYRKEKELEELEELIKEIIKDYMKENIKRIMEQERLNKINIKIHIIQNGKTDKESINIHITVLRNHQGIHVEVKLESSGTKPFKLVYPLKYYYILIIVIVLLLILLLLLAKNYVEILSKTSLITSLERNKINKIINGKIRKVSTIIKLRDKTETKIEIIQDYKENTLEIETNCYPIDQSKPTYFGQGGTGRNNNEDKCITIDLIKLIVCFI